MIEIQKIFTFFCWNYYAYTTHKHVLIWAPLYTCSLVNVCFGTEHDFLHCSSIICYLTYNSSLNLEQFKILYYYFSGTYILTSKFRKMINSTTYEQLICMNIQNYAVILKKNMFWTLNGVWISTVNQIRIYIYICSLFYVCFY